jgi:hypothetical protein
MSLRPFKFFQKKPETVFTEWLDQLDDYHLGGVRPQPDETNPRYYDCNGFVFEGVSETRYDEETYVPYKVMLFRSIDEGNTIEGNIIYPPHPMYDYPDIL